jgi:hypothetical protein
MASEAPLERTEHGLVPKGDGWFVGGYSVNEAALRHGAGVERETADPDQAYVRFSEPEPSRYRTGSLPD